MAPMPDSAGEFGDKKVIHGLACPRCKRQTITSRTWESNCGGYEDEKFECFSCGYFWWEEGPDS